MPSIPDIIEAVLKDDYLNSHGSHVFERLSNAFKNKSSTKILNHYKNIFYQTPITWEAVKDDVWYTEEARDENKFPFMQGDLIKTRMISSLGQSEIAQQHDLWLVCSPTCDLPRGIEYIRVAKVFSVMEIDKEKDSPTHSEFKKLYLSAKFATEKFFPLPPFPEDGNDILGYYADLTTPYFLPRKLLGSATPIHSLRLNSWHLLNSYLMQRDTRSNSEDEPRIRCIAEGLPAIQNKRKEIRVYHGKGENDYSVLARNFIGNKNEQHLQDDFKYCGKWVGENQEKTFWFAIEGLSFDEIKVK